MKVEYNYLSNIVEGGVKKVFLEYEDVQLLLFLAEQTLLNLNQIKTFIEMLSDIKESTLKTRLIKFEKASLILKSKFNRQWIYSLSIEGNILLRKLGLIPSSFTTEQVEDVETALSVRDVMLQALAIVRGNSDFYFAARGSFLVALKPNGIEYGPVDRIIVFNNESLGNNYIPAFNSFGQYNHNENNKDAILYSTYQFKNQFKIDWMFKVNDFVFLITFKNSKIFLTKVTRATATENELREDFSISKERFSKLLVNLLYEINISKLTQDIEYDYFLRLFQYCQKGQELSSEKFYEKNKLCLHLIDNVSHKEFVVMAIREGSLDDIKTLKSLSENTKHEKSLIVLLFKTKEELLNTTIVGNNFVKINLEDLIYFVLNKSNKLKGGIKYYDYKDHQCVI